VGHRKGLDEQPDARLLLEQVLNDVLTNPDPGLQGARGFYGTPGAKRLALLKESPVPWPKKWLPSIPGYSIEYCSRERRVEDFVYWNLPGGPWMTGLAYRAMPRLLAIRLDKLNLQPDRAYDDQIMVSLFNIGGSGGKAEQRGGAEIVYYTIRRSHGKWVVHCAGAFRP
jgi:hypothetical protein